MIPVRLLELARGYRASRVFLSAIELGVFEGLGAERLDGPSLARRLGTDPRATTVMLDALVALGVLDREGETYANIDALEVLWTSETAPVRGGLTHATRLWSTWSGLTDTVRSGRPTSIRRHQHDGDGACAIAAFSATQTERIVAATDWTRVGRLIDVGGGAGVHAIELAQRYPGLQAVVFDASDTAIELAAAAAAEAGIDGRIAVRRGDVRRDDLGDDFDAVLLASVLCLFDEPEARRIVRKSAGALPEGGTLIVHDIMTGDTGNGAAGIALFGVHLLLTSPAGRCHRREHVERWMREAGLEIVRRDVATFTTTLVGLRPTRRGEADDV